MEMGGGLGLGCNSSSTSSDNSIINSINNNSLREVWLPPGFRFHPTDEELLSYYLFNKIKRELEREREEERESPYHTTQMQIEDSLVVIDLNKCEPWDLPEKAKIGEKEWYVYSRRDKKYPSGIRNNRATKRGYWKATGNDRPITTAASPKRYLVGMKKTLVFYTGRAPHGSKTNWVMHEYRLNTRHFPTLPDSSKDKWVLCRLFNKGGQGEKKPIPHILNQTQSFPSQFASENVSLLSTSSLAMGKHSWHQEEDKEEEEECSTIESLLSQQHQLPSWTSFPDLVESLAYGQLIDQGCLHSLVNNKTSTATYSNYSYSPFLDLEHDVLY